MKDPSWERTEEMKTIDLIAIGQRIAQNFRDAATAGGLIADGPPDHLTRLASVVESATTHWESKLSTRAVNQGLPVCEQNIRSMEVPETADFMLELADDSWLTDLLMPMEWQ